MLQHILEKRWTPKPEDKDMIVMWHKFVYELAGDQHEKHSFMICTGENTLHSAMAKTVGLPLGIGALAMLEGRIQGKGVQIPVHKAIYAPVLKELEEYGISFEEKQIR